MLRSSHHLKYSSLLFSSSRILRNNKSGDDSRGGINETAFPEDADWLSDSSSASSSSSHLQQSSNFSSSSSSSPTVPKSSSSTSIEKELPRQSVPIGIRRTNTESLMNRLEKKGGLQEFNRSQGFDSIKKHDVAQRTQRAIAAGSRRNEHFLLADLDPDLDTVMFGTSDEDFEKNVKRMKTIVSTYTKWERWDKIYMYATRVLQFLSVIVGFLLWEAANEKYLLQTAAQDYASQHTALIENVSQNRNQSIDYLLADMKANPPQILPPSKEKYEEIVRLSNVDDIKRHPMDTREVEEWEREKEMLILQRQAQRDSIASCGDNDFIKRARRIILPMTDDWTSVVKEEMVEYSRKKMDELEFPRLEDM